EASDLIESFPATFAGQPVDANSILIRYTLAGDANLDTVVDTIDFNLLAAHFGQDAQSWAQGDFDYNSSVDTVDFNILAGNFAQSLANMSAGDQIIPEPNWSAWLILAGTWQIARARRGIRRNN